MNESIHKENMEIIIIFYHCRVSLHYSFAGHGAVSNEDAENDSFDSNFLNVLV